MRHEDRFFKESDFLFADNILYSFFNVELEKGNPESALDKPHSIVITSEFAQKYIGDEDPIGKLINVEIWINGGSAYSFDDKKLNPSGMDPAGEYMVTGIS